MTVESLPDRQAARNEAITSLLAKCSVPEADTLMTDRNRMMDKRGNGVQIILDQSERLSGRRPFYRSTMAKASHSLLKTHKEHHNDT